MEIDRTIAATIVANIKGVLRHEINLFDTHGTVIASTDAARVGQYHEAAAIAAASRRSIAVDDDHPYQGAKNGINSPVLIDGSVAAVIGVTCALLGMLASILLGTPVGSTIVMLDALSFCLFCVAGAVKGGGLS